MYSLAIGIFIGFFLWFFQPFDINILGYTDLEIWFFGGISFTVFFIAHTLLPLIFPHIYPENKWTVGSQILFYLLILLLIATLNGLYINYLNDLRFNWANYGFIILRTLLIGIIPISLYVLLSFYWKHSNMSKRALSLRGILPKSSDPEEVPPYLIKTHIKGETFPLNEDTFLYAKASGNYIEVYVSQQKPSVYRMNLSDLGTQLHSSKQLLRCHRSYLVNVKQVRNITGNAQGLKLWLGETEDFVPVSRTYIDQVKASMASS